MQTLNKIWEWAQNNFLTTAVVIFALGAMTNVAFAGYVGAPLIICKDRSCYQYVETFHNGEAALRYMRREHFEHIGLWSNHERRYVIRHLYDFERIIANGRVQARRHELRVRRHRRENRHFRRDIERGVERFFGRILRDAF